MHQNYNHQRHLDAVKKYHPHLATIPDILETSNQHLIYSQSLELMEFTDRLIIIPKTKLKEKLLKLPNLILGLPCGRFRNQWTRYYRCYHFSLNNFNINDLFSRQLNLIV